MGNFWKKVGKSILGHIKRSKEEAMSKVRINYHPMTGNGELYFNDAYLLDIQLPPEQTEIIKQRILEFVLKEQK